MSQLTLKMKVVSAQTAEDLVEQLEMGVWEDGTACLSARTLAMLCDVVPSGVIEQGQKWMQGNRDGKLAKMLKAAGFESKALYRPTVVDGSLVHAYGDEACMVILRYYAFEAQTPSKEAQRRYHLLAQAGLRAFIYDKMGYDPSKTGGKLWETYHDRLLLNVVPANYFSVFREMGDWILTAAQNGLLLDNETVPDISIGIVWSTHWKKARLEKKHGARVKFPHTYPDSFPQALANGQIEAWIYPVQAVGDFRVWMQNVYIPTYFVSYLKTRVNKGKLKAGDMKRILASVAPPSLP